MHLFEASPSAHQPHGCLTAAASAFFRKSAACRIAQLAAEKKDSAEQEDLELKMKILRREQEENEQQEQHSQQE